MCVRVTSLLFATQRTRVDGSFLSEGRSRSRGYTSSMERLVTTCYPQYKELVGALRGVPLSTRSLLIKSCQAQQHFTEEDNSTIARLLLKAPPIVYQSRAGTTVVEPINFLKDFEPDLSSPLISAILLDVIRSAPLPYHAMHEARAAGWATEIRLSETPGRPVVSFDSFFFPVDTPIHPDLPHNQRHFPGIRYRFSLFKRRLQEKLCFFYPRATHRNMSRSTRREFEQIFETDIAGFEIFGQDDWQRVYHETGIKVPGVVEMRQKWYASGAKPRTYFAMGGTTYGSCRFLQNFFTELVNLFPATNHITRLRPERLRLRLEGDDHYLVYDLSSFTSNMKEFRSFAKSLADFFRGVIVLVVDECHGPIPMDLGEMLEEYNQVCVTPLLSYERCRSFSDVAALDPVEHARASLLGIFGNLMLCTLAHYLILSPTVEDDAEINIAGDDGLVLRTLLNQFAVDLAISLVGDCAEDKTMLSGEIGTICLKRPLIELPPVLYLARNVVPPGLVISGSYIGGRPIDARYEILGIEDMKLEDRISVVGKDLLRFLEACYTEGISQDEAFIVYNGFSRMVAGVLGYTPVSAPLGSGAYVWPINPNHYDYYSVSPQMLFATYFCQGLSFHRREYESINYADLRYAGDMVRGNSDSRLVLLERLGYLEKKPVVENLSGYGSVERWLSLQKHFDATPILYDYVCNKDIPPVFLYSEVEYI